MKHITFVTLSCVALAAACGPHVRDKDDPDPVIVNNGSNNGGSNNGGSNNGGSNNGGSNNGTSNNGTTNNGTTNNGTTNNGTTNNGTTNNGTTNNGTTNNGTTNNGTNNGTTNNGTNNGTACVVSSAFVGQMGASDEHAGGFLHNTPYSFDAGLSAVLAAAPATEDDFGTPGVNEGRVDLGVPLQVQGAVVTATSFGAAGNRRFWVADRNASIQLFLDAELFPAVRVGDQVSFQVDAMMNFEGHPQIAAVSNYSVLSSDNGVFVREIGSGAVTTADYADVIRVGGTLGASYECGGRTCWELEHGSATPLVLRSGSQFLQAGSCVTFVGPLNSFPGPLRANASILVQADTINFDWLWQEFQ